MRFLQCCQHVNHLLKNHNRESKKTVCFFSRLVKDHPHSSQREKLVYIWESIRDIYQHIPPIYGLYNGVFTNHSPPSHLSSPESSFSLSHVTGRFEPWAFPRHPPKRSSLTYNVNLTCLTIQELSREWFQLDVEPNLHMGKWLGNHHPRWTRKSIPSLKLTVKTPENRPKPRSKKKKHLPTH